MKKLTKKRLTKKCASAAVAMVIMSSSFFAPYTLYANTNLSNVDRANRQAMHQYDNRNWQHNRAYMSPSYNFETTYRYDQWGRPTTSNVTPDHPQNIRRDRHSAYLPPSHGGVTGVFSGYFETHRANPFMPNNNNASRAIGADLPSIAIIPGEAGVNVRASGEQSGVMPASTSISGGGGGNSVAGTAAGGVSGGAPQNVGNLVPQTQPGLGQGGFAVTHTPIQTGQSQGINPIGRIITVTPFADGTIGRISIPALGMERAVRSGVDMPTLNNYVGHFPVSSQWDGNIALASHNRGPGSFFADIWNLQLGDRIFYETTLGVRQYEVIRVEQISENDTSNLSHTHENTLTMVTCVANVSNMRWSVTAREVR
ncbi:MAG: sortase [Defluviitaleaceae bacterium]|nr:sortase [Defluviitaleaceae bacterium]